jgi:Lrp/AsnC family transcriptional regulator, regulator of ectoine-degradation genes
LARRKSGFITKVALAERVGLSQTPCWNRLRRLEEAGIISGYARVSPRSVVPITFILFEIKVGGHKKLHGD